MPVPMPGFFCLGYLDTGVIFLQKVLLKKIGQVENQLINVSVAVCVFRLPAHYVSDLGQDRKTQTATETEKRGTVFF
jgi:hypothetical protein